MTETPERPPYDITDTACFRLDIWQRIVKLEAKLNGVNPSACRSFVNTNIALLWASNTVVLTVLLYMVFK